MSKKKRPDNVAWDEEKGRWVANILPYASNVGAPKIVEEDIVGWKSKNVHKLNKQFKDKFLSLKDEYLKLLDEYKWNDLVYRSKYNFEPVIGETYHLYDNDKGEMFLSLIEPHEWDRICIGSFKLNHENKWIKIKTSTK